MKPLFLRMAGRDVVRVMKPVFLRNGESIPVWELAKLAPSGPDIPKAKERGTVKSVSKSEAAKKAWETIRRKRGSK